MSPTTALALTVVVGVVGVALVGWLITMAIRDWIDWSRNNQRW